MGSAPGAAFGRRFAGRRVRVATDVPVDGAKRMKGLLEAVEGESVSAGTYRFVGEEDVEVGDTTVTGKLKAPDAGGKTVIVANRVEPALPDKSRRRDGDVLVDHENFFDRRLLEKT